MKFLCVLALLVIVCECRRTPNINKLEKILEETRDILDQLKRDIGGGDETTCVDVNANCEKIKEKAGDKWTIRCEKGAFLKENCKKTCGNCDSGSGGSTGGSGGSTDGTGGSGGSTGGSGESTGGSGGSSGSNVSGVEDCMEDNKGHCECGDTSSGFNTYVFQIDNVTRCFTVYRPLSRSSEKLPVVLSSQCYGKDKLISFGMTSERGDENQAAARYAFARIGLSTPDGHWTFGNDGVVNDEKPMPCSDDDSKDIPYVKTVLEFIESNPDQFDSSRIWAEGFSQNSMFSAYIGFCFSDKVIGIWQGGSGMALTGESPNLPGCQAQVKASIFSSECSNCNQCKTSYPCTECEYWPIYPCYQPKRAIIDCLADYKNDYIASGREDSEEFSTSKYMAERLESEGHDSRVMRFSASEDGSIPGGHKNPQNTAFWQVGCLGITSPCSKECERAFVECVNDKPIDLASDRIGAFQECIDVGTFNNLPQCVSDCAPTFIMLKESETPEVEPLNFGANDLAKHGSRPGSSLCEVSNK